MVTTIEAQVQVRRDTLTNWQAKNPTLADGELAWVTDTRDLLAGDGSTDFNSLWLAAQSIPNRAQASADAAAASAASAASGPAAAVAEGLVFTGQTPRARLAVPVASAVGKPNGIGGGAASNPGSNYVVGDEITLAGGVLFGTSGPAVLRITAVNQYGAITGVTGVIPGAYSTLPANPVAIASTTSAAGTGATITTNSAPATTVGKSAVQVSPTDARFRVTGLPLTNLNSSGYYVQNADNGTHCMIEWQTDATKFDIRGIGVNTKAVLFVDGVEFDAVGMSTDTSGAGYLWSLDFGGARRMRSFKMLSVNTGWGGVLLPSDATLQAPLPTGRRLAWWLGDSYTFGTGAETLGSQGAVVAGHALGLDVLPDGVGGAGWMASTSGSALDRVNEKVGNIGRLPDIIVWDLGFNNASSDLTAVASAMDSAIARAKVLAPSAQHVGFGPATPQGATGQLTALRDVMRARFGAASVPFVDVTDWVNVGNKATYTGTDNVHPTALGHKYLGARKAIAARPLLAL
jgi:lysophospholipase L1-like esterase